MSILIVAIAATSVCRADVVSHGFSWKFGAYGAISVADNLPGWVTNGGDIPLAALLPAGTDVVLQSGIFGEDPTEMWQGIGGFASVEDARRRERTMRKSVFFTGNNDPKTEMESLSALSKLDR